MLRVFLNIFSIFKNKLTLKRIFRKSALRGTWFRKAKDTELSGPSSYTVF